MAADIDGNFPRRIVPRVLSKPRSGSSISRRSWSLAGKKNCPSIP
uniref:Uncharacterized protein n=1 Tax=Rhizophora mucronata TaxID=61149 RepID=A0A2P2KKK2_RHIMU